MTKSKYLLFTLFLVVLGGILPSLYPIFAYSISSNVYFTLSMISSQSWLVGYLYTGAASVLLMLVAWVFKPRFLRNSSMQFYREKFMPYEGPIYITALSSLIIIIVLNMLYGMSASNLSPQRPIIAVYFGYIALAFWYSPILYIMAQIFFYGKLNRMGWLLLCFFLAVMASYGSRSGLLSVFFIVLMGLAYSPRILKIKVTMFAIIILLGLSSAVIGDLLRGGDDLLEPLASILFRLFSNNQVLFLSVENQEKIRDILLYNEPTVMLNQMFSFIMERTEYPSSCRLLEYWGGIVAESERGHITGYAYGWLGLTYGIFGWYGLWFVTAILSFYFFVLRALFSKPTFSNLAFSAYFSGMLFEFFMNLGLDSYVEKIFKGFISVSVYIVIIVFLNLSVRAGRGEIKFRSSE